jgi:hypothetical protein
MKVTSKALLFILLGSILLSACGAVTPVPEVMPPPLVTLATTQQPTQTTPISLPTVTPTATIPPIPIPTLLPITVAPDSRSYRLVQWTPEMAEGLIRLMENYPDTLSYIERGYHDSSYIEAFHYATWAGYEALLRYPDHPRAENWKWWLGNDIAWSYQFTYGGQAGDYYANLIGAGLKSGEVTIDSLRDWIFTKDPTSQTELIRLDAPEGFTHSYVLQFNSLYLWILENPDEFQVYPLVDNFYYYPNKFEIQDLTGDNAKEFIVSFFRDTNFVSGVSEAFVFDLSRVPYQKLSFISTLYGSSSLQDSKRWIGYDWSILPSAGDGSVFQLREEYLLSCPIYRLEDYRWNGNWFALEKVHFQFEVTNSDSLQYCGQLLLGNSFLFAEPEEVLSLFESLLPYWPILDSYLESPDDAKDELRFRLGVLHALASDKDKAIDYFNGIVQSPSVYSSSWIDPSKEFLSIYTAPDQIYRACISTSACNPKFAIEQLVTGMDSKDYLSVVGRLKALGVNVLDTSLYDFDHDKSPEIWFTVRIPRTGDIEFWIISQSSNGVIAQFVTNVSTKSPNLSVSQLDPGTSMIQIDKKQLHVFYPSQDGGLDFYEAGQAENTLPDILVRRIFEQYRRDLYDGKNPKEVQESLLALQKHPDFICDPKLTEDNSFKYWDFPYPNYCAAFLYTMGLTYELSGDAQKATEIYWQLWHDFPESPYALMAQYKLEPVSP